MRFLPIVGAIVALGSSSLAAVPPSDEVTAERKRLDELLAVEDASAQASGLVALLGEAKDAEVRRYAHRALAQAYGRVVTAGGAREPDVEARLVDVAVGPQDLLSVCYGFATQRPLEALATRCLAAIPADLRDPALAAERSRLAGTLALGRGDPTEAQSRLAAAALVIGPDQDPLLYARLGAAQLKAGKKSAACGTGRTLFRAAPLMAAARDLLGSCEDPTGAAASLTAELKRSLVASDRATGAPVPVLSLEDSRLQPVDLDLAKSGKVTVLIFFSTWCPHCGVELPRVVRFARELARDRKRAATVDLVGVRTAVEREREPYDAFAKRHGIAFRVLTDPAMSLVFSQFAKAIGRPAMLPCITVLDGRGVVRFVLEPGDYKDTTSELTWAVDALVR